MNNIKTINKRGNSQGIYIDKILCNHLGVNVNGGKVKLTIEKDKIIITKADD